MTRALIADDDSLVANTLTEECKKLGWQTMTTSTTTGIIGTIKKYNPNVIFLDILLPGKTGLEVVDDIKKELPEMLKKIVIVTSMDNQSYLAEAIEKGIIHYATKNTENPSGIMNIAKEIVGVVA